jgi:hypothetical protein
VVYDVMPRARRRRPPVRVVSSLLTSPGGEVVIRAGGDAAVHEVSARAAAIRWRQAPFTWPGNYGIGTIGRSPLPTPR